MRDIIKRWQTSPQDNSSCDVGIGVYTEKIQRLEIDMHGVDKETKEFLGMRALLVRYVFARRKLLNYLQKAHFGRYLKAILKAITQTFRLGTYSITKLFPISTS